MDFSRINKTLQRSKNGRKIQVIVSEAKKEPKATSNEIKKAAGPIGEKVSAVPVRRVILDFGLIAKRSL